MYEYDEFREVSQDLDGATERLVIEIRNHQSLFERENRSEEADSMLKKLSDAVEILDDLIGYLESKTEK